MTSAGTSTVAPVIGIAGWKNAGKTTLAVRLIEEFTRRGLRVASVKHAHHSFEIDDPKTDSARHRRAGAAQVAIVSQKRWAVMTELGAGPEPSLSEIISKLAPADLIVVEGYKRAPILKNRSAPRRRNRRCFTGINRHRCDRHRNRCANCAFR